MYIKIIELKECVSDVTAALGEDKESERLITFLQLTSCKALSLLCSSLSPYKTDCLQSSAPSSETHMTKQNNIDSKR